MTEISFASLLIACASLVVSGFAFIASRRSAFAAERSADEAHNANELTRVAAERSARTQVIAVNAERDIISFRSARQMNSRALNLKNIGRATAREVKSIIRDPDGRIYLMSDQPSLLPGEELRIRGQSDKPPTAAEKRGAPKVPQMRMGVRLYWKNDDDSQGEAPWQLIPDSGQ